MLKCSRMVSDTAPSRGVLLKNLVKSVSCQDLTESIRLMRANMSVVSTIVCQRGLAACQNHQASAIRITPKSRLIATIFHRMPLPKMLSFGLLGGRSIMLRSAGSRPSVTEGSPSATRLTHRICIGVSGNGRPRKGAHIINQIVPEFPVSVCLIYLRMLS